MRNTEKNHCATTPNALINNEEAINPVNPVRKKKNRDGADPDRWRSILFVRLRCTLGGDGRSGGETSWMGSESTGRRQVSVRGREGENGMPFDDWKNLEFTPTVSQPKQLRL
jgi:hypothetical protein